MAKYRLNNRLVECNILDENLLADTYTIKVNGNIKNVSRRKVSQLDHIDEAVLDRLKKFAASLWDNIIKKGKYVIMKIKGMFVPVNSPINTMIAAQDIEGVSFYPSESLANAAEDLGISANVIEDEGEEDENYIQDCNDFLRQEIEIYKEENGIEDEELDESYSSRRNRRKRLYEGHINRRGTIYRKSELYKDFMRMVNESSRKSRRERLYEDATPSEKYTIESKAWENYNAQEIVRKLVDQFAAIQAGAAKLGSSSIPIPYCIWGSPGIGKTQIVEQLVESAQQILGDVNLISINAMSMRKDDFTFPANGSKEIEVVNSKGETVKYTKTGGVDIMKTWLPAYKPGDKNAADLSITDEQLDDIANGGDGSGNGNGGVIFFDELSRISPDVLNVIMTVVQSRQFNDYVIGSKWMMVAAANPPQVLASRAADSFQWDDAQTDRFQHIFFVPTFKDWLKWAKKPMKGTNRPRIDEDIIRFLTAHQECWNNVSLRYKEDKKDKVASSKFANPRSWANASKAIRDTEDAIAAENDPNSFVSRMNKLNGFGNRPTKLSQDEKRKIINANVGVEASRAYAEFYSFDGIFSTDIAESVWEDGATAEIPFGNSALNLILDRAIAKIFACHPDITEPNPEITADQFKNLCEYIVRCVDLMDENSGASGDVILNQAISSIIKCMKENPFRVNMNLPEIKEKYKAGLLILEKRRRQTRNTISSMR